MGEEGGPLTDAAFLSWLRSRGVDTRAIAWPCGQGELRNVAAAVPLRRGDVVLSVPATAMLTPALCLRTMGHFIRVHLPLLEHDNDELALAMFLLHESAVGAASPWWHYLRVLPRPEDLSGLLPAWSHDEAAALCDADALLTATTRSTAWRDEFASASAAVIAGAASPDTTISAPAARLLRVWSWEAVCWARGCVSSRSFLDGFSSDELFCCDETAGMLSLALVPGGDMFNHTPNDGGGSGLCEAEWVPEGSGGGGGGGSYVLRTTTACAAGTPLFISYGPHSDCELLCSYGFLPSAAAGADAAETGHTQGGCNGSGGARSLPSPIQPALSAAGVDSAVLQSCMVALGAATSVDLRAVLTMCLGESPVREADAFEAEAEAGAQPAGGEGGSARCGTSQRFAATSVLPTLDGLSSVSAAAATPSVLRARIAAWSDGGSPLTTDLVFLGAGAAASPPTDIMRVLRACALDSADIGDSASGGGLGAPSAGRNTSGSRVGSPRQVWRRGGDEDALDSPLSRGNEVRALHLLAAVVVGASALVGLVGDSSASGISAAATEGSRHCGVPLWVDAAADALCVRIAEDASALELGLLLESRAASAAAFSPVCASSSVSSGAKFDTAATFVPALVAKSTAGDPAPYVDSLSTTTTRLSSATSSSSSSSSSDSSASVLRRLLAARYRIQRRSILLSNLRYVSAMLRVASGVNSLPIGSDDEAPPSPSTPSSLCSSLMAALRPVRYCLEVQGAWSDALMSGSKTIETRAYPLPPDLLGVPLGLLWSPSPGGLAVHGGHAGHLVGTVSFSTCFRYTSRTQWEADAGKHGVDPGELPSQFGWVGTPAAAAVAATAVSAGSKRGVGGNSTDSESAGTSVEEGGEEGAKYGWVVSAVEPLKAGTAAAAVPVALDLAGARRLRSIYRLGGWPALPYS